MGRKWGKEKSGDERYRCAAVSLTMECSLASSYGS